MAGLLHPHGPLRRTSSVAAYLLRLRLLVSALLAVSLTLPACARERSPPAAAMATATAPAVAPGQIYTETEASPDGIGKVYEGREISFVMGHRGADWLERPTREAEERTDLLLDNLPLEAADVIADIGAGTGYFSLALATRVPKGRVLAVDIQQEMLDIIASRTKSAGIHNVERLLATDTDPRLPPGAIDLVLLVDRCLPAARSRPSSSCSPPGRSATMAFGCISGSNPTKPCNCWATPERTCGLSSVTRAGRPASWKTR